MGGTVEIANAKDGGLMVHLRLRRVTGDEPLPKGRERRRSTV